MSIGELVIGDFVVDIVEQQGDYCLTQANNIKSQLVIDNLKAKGVISVLVDPSKAKKPLSERRKQKATTVIVDVQKAKAIFDKSKDIQAKVFQDALDGKALEVEPVAEITDKAIDEVFKNPDALACVINIRNKDEYLLEHSVSVSVLITIFAKYLKIDRNITHKLAIGAFLHDVGKIMISDDILHKPGKLTSKEFEVMKTHVNHSINIIEQTPGVPALSLEVARLHHEKLDGTGYPFNVKGDDISMYGRMIAICDIFDALSANRCYKQGYSHIKAFSILRSLADNNHLDSRLVNLFIKCMGVYPVGSLVELNSNKIAIVEQRNQDDPTNPKVRSFYNKKHGRYIMTEDVDLAKEEDFIVKGVRADDYDLDMNKIVEFLLMEG